MPEVAISDAMQGAVLEDQIRYGSARWSLLGRKILRHLDMTD